MRIKIRVVDFLLLHIARLNSASQCVVSDLKMQKPDLSCCDMTKEENECVFTSICNTLGICCQDPYDYDGYAPLQ